MKKVHTSAKKLPQVGSNLQETAPKPVLKKRDNIFSRSKDIREDRGTIRTKTEQAPETMHHPGSA